MDISKQEFDTAGRFFPARRKTGAIMLEPSRKYRELDEATVLALMDSMKRVGMLNPIRLDGRSQGDAGLYLVAGRHRLEAAKRLGWEVVPVIMLIRDSEAHQSLSMIDENLIRKDLSEVERALALADRPRLLALIDASEDGLRDAASAKIKKRKGEVASKNLPATSPKKSHKPMGIGRGKE